jgi:hypothetical protein
LQGSDDNLRVLTGRATSVEIIKTVFDGLNSLEEYRDSVMLTTLAAAAKFDESPHELLTGVRKDAPMNPEWSDDRLVLLNTIEALREMEAEEDVE